MVVNTVLSILGITSGMQSGCLQQLLQGWDEEQQQAKVRWGFSSWLKAGVVSAGELRTVCNCDLLMWTMHVYVCVVCVHVFARMPIHTHVDARAWCLVSLCIPLYFIPWGKDSAEARVPECGLQEVATPAWFTWVLEVWTLGFTLVWHVFYIHWASSAVLNIFLFSKHFYQ